MTAGMYVGGRESAPNRAMIADRIITDHETMLSSPPDILLTNYKMLDFLLVRPKDAILWKDNTPETLKYIAVDELHTFDGAQGTDLACLLRRLKSRLYTPVGHLCCVGTSATMGDKESAEGILSYAGEVFGEPFEADAVVTEDRLSAAEFFAASATIDFSMPGENAASLLWEATLRENRESFLETAIKVWFDESFSHNGVMSDETRLAIGNRLMGHSFTQALISHIAGKYVQTEKVCEELGAIFPELVKTPCAALALDALYALISHARIGEPGRLRPFVTMQVQLWIKELRRLVAKVSRDNITYALARELNRQQAAQYLPAVNCRDCGETGWVSVINERGNATLGDLDTFYNLYFKQDKKVVMIYPHSHEDAPWGMIPAYLCPSCLKLDIVGASEEKRHAC